LINGGADINNTDFKSNTALKFAEEEKNTEIVRYLKNNGGITY